MPMIGWRVSPETDLAACCRQAKAGRWHHAQRLLLYCSTTPELAVLEARAHHRVGISGYYLQQVYAARLAPIQQIAPDSLPDTWVRQPRLTRALGETWLRDGASAGLLVPSSLCPESNNLLINPALAIDLELVHTRRFRFDRRLVLTL